VDSGRRVKLLLDENLSRKIVPALQEAFPGSTQVALLGMERSDDRELWEHAKSMGFVLVTKDEDFMDLAATLGYPPKLILLRLGNCTNQQILDALLASRSEIEAHLARDDVGVIDLYSAS
jgi:predicted nuclease of predicted toxin-antitoxin system